MTAFNSHRHSLGTETESVGGDIEVHDNGYLALGTHSRQAALKLLIAIAIERCAGMQA